MKIVNKALLMLFVVVVQVSYSGDFLKQFVKSDTNQKFFVGVIEEKQKLLDEFEKEQLELTSAHTLFTEKNTRQLDELKTLLTNVDSQLQKNPEDDFFIKQQLILKESEQILKDTQRIYDDNLSLVAEIITQLRSFIEDPHFEAFKKKNKLSERLYYSFDDLQLLHDHILDYEQRVAQLTEQEKSLRIEKESRKRAIAAIQEEYDKRQQDIKIYTEAIAA